MSATDRIIEIKINGSHLTHDSQTAGVQHEGNAAALRLHFDPGWDGFAKTVTFWNAAGGNPVRRMLTADLLEDMAADSRVYRCPIPPEAMTEPGKLTYIIDGMAGDVRQRSVEDTLRVLPAGDAPEAGEPADPTPTQAEQLQMQVDALLEELQQSIAAAAAAKDSAGAAKVSEQAAQAALGGVQTAIQSIPAGATPIVNDLTTGGANMALSAEMGKKLLPLDGSKPMTGAVRLNGDYGTAEAYNGNTLLRARKAAGNDNDSSAVCIYPNNALAHLLYLRQWINGTPNNYLILHTGNKPGGSYTGNGSAAARTVETGGIGHAVIAWTSVSIALVTYSGAICCNLNTGEVVATKNANFRNGVLTLTTAGDLVNFNGNTYNYQVL